jgi:hypothetical protein
MNDAFNASEREGEAAYWKLVSEVLAGKVIRKQQQSLRHSFMRKRKRKRKKND